jgi:hypothetical protein
MDPATLEVAKLRRSEEHMAAEAFQTYMAGKHAPLAMDCDSGMNQIGG